MTLFLFLSLACKSSDADTSDLGCPNAADSAWFVSEDASVDGDGSATDPFLTIELGLAAFLEQARPVAICAGDYRTNLDIVGSDYDDLVLLGSDAVLTPSDSEESVLTLKEARGVQVSGLAIEGGTSPLVVWGGAQVTLQDVQITDASVAGMVLSGGTTAVSASELWIQGVEAGAETTTGVGAGIVAIDASLTLDSSTISDTVGVGILVDGSATSAQRFQAFDTVIQDIEQTASGTLGRGVHVQRSEVGTMAECKVERVADAGVFFLMVEDAQLSDSTIDSVTATALGQGGDGAVFTGDDGGGPYVGTFAFTATGNSVSAIQAGRAGMLADAATAIASSNNLQDGAAMVLLYQNSAAVPTGTDSALELTGESVLTMDQAALISSEFTP